MLLCMMLLGRESGEGLSYCTEVTEYHIGFAKIVVTSELTQLSESVVLAGSLTSVASKA